MAPMARTSRKDPSLNALDDLNLDDMFEGGQDGLFDELGMDLGDLGDITNDKKSGVPPVPKGLDDMQFDLMDDIGIDDGDNSLPPEETASPVKKSRRTTKRKPKESSFDTDDEEEGPSKKKRRYTKKTKATTKKSKAEVEPPPAVSPKNKKSKASSAAPAMERKTSVGSLVAAAGQFGGRHKRGQYHPLPRSTSKPVKAKSKAPPPVAPVPVPPVLAPQKIAKLAEPVIPQPQTVKRGRAIIETSKPLETLFCGLKPSDTLFYPFMSTLPPEASMKKCNKHYISLEKINASLAATTPGPDSEDALLKLMMFHDPVPTKEKKLLMSASILASRKVVGSTDRHTLVADLASVATLVKRQHDFLAQSMENMERWCKGNFSGDDYRAVYGGEKPKPVLAQLTSPIVRVRIRFNGFKETKLSAPLIAQIPIPGASAKPPPLQVSTQALSIPVSNVSTTATTPTTTTITTTTTKRKRVESSTAASITADAVEEPVLHYVDLQPHARRQRILDLIAKHALLLETKHAEMDESRRKALEKQHQVLQKVVNDDDLLAVNTTTLWKWVDKACYLNDFTEHDIRDLLVYQPEVDDEHLLWEDTHTKKKLKPVQESLYERLQSLLVEVDDDDDEDAEEEEDNDVDVDILWAATNGAKDAGETLLDLGELTIEERAFLHLRAAGLVDESRPPPEAGVEHENGDDNDETEEDTSEYEELLRRMKVDLLRVDRLNNSRTVFLESSARAHLESTKLMKRQDERNGQMITKYNTILKKQKENKRSARQKFPRKDEDWVPW